MEGMTLCFKEVNADFLLALDPASSDSYTVSCYVLFDMPSTWYSCEIEKKTYLKISLDNEALRKFIEVNCSGREKGRTQEDIR